MENDFYAMWKSVRSNLKIYQKFLGWLVKLAVRVLGSANK